jgi:hypothetical protein
MLDCNAFKFNFAGSKEPQEDCREKTDKIKLTLVIGYKCSG